MNIDSNLRKLLNFELKYTRKKKNVCTFQKPLPNQIFASGSLSVTTLIKRCGKSEHQTLVNFLSANNSSQVFVPHHYILLFTHVVSVLWLQIKQQHREIQAAEEKLGEVQTECDFFREKLQEVTQLPDNLLGRQGSYNFDVDEMCKENRHVPVCWWECTVFLSPRQPTKLLILFCSFFMLKASFSCELWGQNITFDPLLQK